MASKDKSQIIRYIQDLYADRTYSLDEAWENMQEIEEVASTNAAALADDIATRDGGEGY